MIFPCCFQDFDYDLYMCKSFWICSIYSKLTSQICRLILFIKLESFIPLFFQILFSFPFSVSSFGISIMYFLVNRWCPTSLWSSVFFLSFFFSVHPPDWILLLTCHQLHYLLPAQLYLNLSLVSLSSKFLFFKFKNLKF